MDSESITQEPVTNKINDPESIIPELETGKTIKVVPITEVLTTGATWMGMVACWWAVMLMQGGIFFTTVETKDCLFVMIILLFISFRHRITFCPTAHWSTYRTNRSMWGSIQQLAFPVCFILGLLYWCKLVSAIVCAVLCMMQLVSQDFGQNKVDHMATRNFSLNVFYVLALIETLLSLLDLILRKFFERAIEIPNQQKFFEPMMEEKKTDRKDEKFRITQCKCGDKLGAFYSEQKDESNNFGVNRRKAPSVVDPAGNGKQTEEKKVEAKKSQ